MIRTGLLSFLIATASSLTACTDPKQPRTCSPEVGDRVLAPNVGDRPATRDAAGDYVCE